MNGIQQQSADSIEDETAALGFADFTKKRALKRARVVFVSGELKAQLVERQNRWEQGFRRNQDICEQVFR